MKQRGWGVGEADWAVDQSNVENQRQKYDTETEAQTCVQIVCQIKQHMPKKL